MSTEKHADRAAVPDDIPVENASSMMEVIRQPEYLREWLVGLEPANLESTYQVTGDADSHTLGENMVFNMDMARFPNSLTSLEKSPDPQDGDPPHGILRYPRTLLDNIIHLSEMDKWRLDFGTVSDLPRTRRHTFEYLLDDDTTVDASDLEAVGGTDALIYGPMGRGKTTVVQTLVARILEINNETVVWRGTPQRTEWLPFAPWAIVCLPSGIDYEVTLAPPEDDSGLQAFDFDPLRVELEDLVWDVRRYDDLDDLNNNVLEPGAFHVVYPDPRFRQCEQITRQASECIPLDYDSAWSDKEADEITPPSHWWFSWLVHQNVNEERSMRMTWVCDEASNIFKHHASNEKHQGLATKIEAVSQQYVDFRRNGLSFILLTQKPKEISWMIRKKMRWGVTLSGTSNPTPGDEIIGVNPDIPHDFTSGWEIGRALFWTSNTDCEIRWNTIPRYLKVPGKLRVVSPQLREVMSR